MGTGLLKPLKVAFISTYPPRQCGIATFTQDLVNSLSQLYGDTLAERGQESLQVIALNRASPLTPYPPEVKFEIRDQHKEDYRDAAHFLTLSLVDVVSLQHEFGIFGGPEGRHIIHLLEHLKKPVVTTLHTLLKSPNPTQRNILQKISSLSTLMVVQSQTAMEILTAVYNVPREKITMIHHGTPDVPFLDSSYYKDQFQAEGRFLILTFGFLSPNKGIEFAIDGLASVVKKFPKVLYLIVGITHPEVKQRFGERYRLLLERRVRERGLEEWVVFQDRFVSLERLIQYLVAADIYLAPYLAEEQVVSGTLAYALACGKPIVATPSWYAKEILAEGRGCLVPFRDSKAIADSLLDLLGEETKRNRIRKLSYQFGRQMSWREVSGQYAEVFERALLEYGRKVEAGPVWLKATKSPALPDIDLAHLERMTDDTGLLQHAVFTTPDWSHGYCTDDNARALIVTLMNWQLFQDKGIFPLLYTYLAFLNYALEQESGRMRNFMAYDRKWLEEVGSEDSHGRAVWALGYTTSCSLPSPILGLSVRLFQQAIRSCLTLSFPRPWAFSILGGISYLQRFPGDTEVRNIVVQLAQRLYDLFEINSSQDWPWAEDILSYENARLVQALIAAGYQFEDEEILNQGLKSLKWLIEEQTDSSDEHLTIIGNQGWFKRGKERARFDQQPVDAAALVDACWQAAVATGDVHWQDRMELAFSWFLGRNDLNQMLYDFSTSGCYDGLQPGGVNQNQGGESTVSWLLALHRMHLVTQQGDLLEGKK